MTPILEDIYELFDHHIIVDAVKSSVLYLNKIRVSTIFKKLKFEKTKMLHSKKSLYSSNSELFHMISSVAYFFKAVKIIHQRFDLLLVHKNPEKNCTEAGLKNNSLLCLYIP